MFSKILRAAALLSLSTTAFAQSSELFTLLSLSDPGKDNSSVAVVINNSDINGLRVGDRVTVPLISGGAAAGTLIRDLKDRSLTGADSDISASTVRIVSLDNNLGSVSVHMTNNIVAGITLLNTPDNTIYQSPIDGNGQGALTARDPNSFVCVDMPLDPATSPASLSRQTLATTPDLATLRTLQSKPGAANLVFLNYWGGTLTGQAWNDNFNSGNDIIYTPYSADGDPNSFSTTELTLMWVGYNELVEDYAAFDINVTTDINVYNATAPSDRSQIIATTTNYFYQGAGGVAYVNVYDNSTDYYKTAWTWNSGLGSLGMTNSHELGHNMGLRHHGTITLAYYRGHGSWGPIMGAPFNKKYVQWSKGEYPNANNSTQDDLQILTNVLGVTADDASDTNGSATVLTLPATDIQRQISPPGALSDTADWFIFDLPSSGNLEVSVKTRLGSLDQNTAANLAMDLNLYQGTTLVAQAASDDVTPLSPLTNILTYAQDPATSGPYRLEVKPKSPDLNWATGFGEYGNGGQYTLNVTFEGTAAGPYVSEPIDGAELALDQTFTWNGNGVSVDYYWFYLGSQPGSRDIYDSGILSSSVTSVSVDPVPATPSHIYGKLFWYTAGAWSSASYSYDAPPATLPSVSAPQLYSQLPTGAFDVTWNQGTGADYYWVGIGDTPQNNIYYSSGGLSTGTSSHTVNPINLPDNGSSVWLTLYYYNAHGNSEWLYTSYLLQSPSTIPFLTTPAFYETTLASNTVNFAWTEGSASTPQYYWLYAGTLQGANDLGDSRPLVAPIQNYEISGLPADGSTIWIRIHWYSSGSWDNRDYQFSIDSSGSVSAVPSLQNGAGSPE